MMKTIEIILASGSPRRKEILDKLKLYPRIIMPDIDESHKPNEKPHALVHRLSYEKAYAVAKNLDQGLIIGSDTIVVVDNQILTQPKTAEEAKAMLTAISGRTHQVLTGMTLIYQPNHEVFTQVAMTNVIMNPLTPDWINDYVATGEPMDKAGAYGIQGIGATLVNRIDGEYSTVVGLSVQTLMDGFKSLNLNYFDLIKQDEM
jgi:septum formation protein